MHPHNAGSAMEHLWADEVRRLHSLWHQGLPRNAKTRNPKPGATAGLGPSSGNLFKKNEKRRNRKEDKMQRKAAKKLAEQLSLCDEGTQTPDRTKETSCSVIKWPSEPAFVSVQGTGWGDWSQKPADSVPAMPASLEEKDRLAAMRVHQKALKCCQDYFSREGSSDAEEEDEEEDDSMDGDGGGDGEGRGSGEDHGGSLNFKFFLGLFEEDGDLRAYYERKWEKGEFCCLVCEAIGVKVGKRFGDCVALVQHSSSITKSKRMEAHRAFGRAICRVLGWDITRLPSIVLHMGETLGQKLAKAPSLQEDGDHKQEDEVSMEGPQPGANTDDGMMTTTVIN